MPALVLFSRRWNIGSDDFLFFPVLSAIVRSFWIGCIVAEWGVIVGHFRSIETCENGLEVELYFLGALVLQVLFVAEELVLTYAASKGGTMVPSARHSVPKILVVRLALWIIELCWTVFGSYVMITQQGCAQDSRLHEVVFDGFVVSEWVLVSAYFAIWYLAWDPVGKRTHVHGLSHRHEEAYHQNWAKRVRRACAFTTVEVEAFEEIAALFANLFRNVDLVPSDVAVGLVLLRKQQKRDNRNLVASTNINYRDGSRASIVGCHMVGRRRSSASGRLLCLPDADRALMFTLVRFMKYAFGAYGWPMFMVQNKACGCCLLCRGRCAMELLPTVTDESTCGCCNLSAYDLAARSASSSYELIETNPMNKNSFSPYIVLVDHEDRSVVVSFRGTLSLQDVVTDVRAHGEALLDDNGSTRGHVHKGILKVARNLKNDIVKRGTVLKQLERFPQYRLALTGHSLGAGTATLVAALLKGNVEFDRRLHCYAFSPPGALGCEDISVAVKPYVTAVAFGKDIIPRLSEVTIQKLRDDIVFHLSVNGHCPKHRVIGTCGCRSYSPPPEVQSMMSSGPPGVPSPLRETVLNIDDANIPGKLAESMAAFAEHSTRVQKDALEQRRRMYPMGSLLHFVKDERDDRSCLPSFRKKWKYSPMWRRYDELQEIMISREMVNDHFPDRNLDILLSVLERVQQGILLDIPTSDLSREGLMSPYSIAVQSPFGAPSSAPFSTRMDPLTSPSSPARQRSPFDWQPRLLGDDSPSLSFKRLDTNPGSDAASLSPLSPKISSKQNVLNPSGQDAVCRL